MRKKIRDKDRLIHILEAVDMLTGRPISQWEEEVRRDRVMFYAMAKLLELVGEAS